jgi:hypothetical protein
MEVGLWADMASSTGGTGLSRMISFGESYEPWEYYTGSAWAPINTTANTTLDRIGSDCITMSTTSGITRYRISFGQQDYSIYHPNDYFKFGTAWTTGIPDGTDPVKVIFATDDSNYFQYTPTIGTLVNGSASTYRVSGWAKSLWTSSGSPSWSTINSIEFRVNKNSGACNFFLDAIRVEDYDAVSSGYGLVSRSVLTTPIAKPIGTPMDIEYYVDI